MCGEAAWALRASRLSHFSTATKVSGPSLAWFAPQPSASIAGAYSMQPASAWTAGMLARNAASTASRWPGLAVIMARTWIMAGRSGRMGQRTSATDYDPIAETYAAGVDTRSFNALYERPATLALLPEVSGLAVLDAGCGPGWYAQFLAERGAHVIAVDASPRMAALAAARLGARAAV